MVGLSVAEGQLRLVHVARAKQAVAVIRTATAPLTLDLLHPEADLVGRELRNHVEAAGIRERHCVVALPPAWVMTQHSAVPDLSPDDLASLLQIEAEKGFPCDPDELQIARSAQQAANQRFICQLAVRKDQLDRLSDVLRRAGLKPVSFSLGLAALPGAMGSATDGTVTLVVEPKGASLLIAAGGGIAAFRTLEASIDSENGEAVVNGPALARELRITFEQVPPVLRQDVRRLVLRGHEQMVRQLGEILGPWAADAGLEVDLKPATGRSVGEEIAERLALRVVQDGPPELEFLPPRPSRWSVLMARYSSKRLATAGFAAAAAVVALLLAFGWQEYRLWTLRSEWDRMAAQVADLEATQGRIREFRSWYDTSFRNLTIMKRVIECFPDNGSVTAKTFEIHSPASVSVSGTARDNASLLRTLDQLRQAREIQGLKIEQIRGKTPAQFNFTFRWVGTTGA
ncbi:MAG: pilus assembly protein PilM [Opitutaceae bacterium]|nr:pilus assembly protein PilM [Opitutaceae bacterium]